MRIVCLVQARMDSRRFPGKALEDLAGTPILGHLVARCRDAGLPTVIATTDRLLDDPIAHWAITERNPVDLFRWDGDTADVLGRFLACAREYHAEAIIRVTGDSPWVPVEVLETISAKLRAGSPLAALRSTFGFEFQRVPDGWEAEGCLTKLLAQLDDDQPTAEEREHVLPGIYARLKAWGLVAPPTGRMPWNEPWLLQQKFSVDTPEDLKWLRQLSNWLYCMPPSPTAEDLRTLLTKHPVLLRAIKTPTTEA